MQLILSVYFIRLEGGEEEEKEEEDEEEEEEKEGKHQPELILSTSTFQPDLDILAKGVKHMHFLEMPPKQETPAL